MVRTHARRTKRRFEQRVDKRSDEERTKEADKIIKNLMASQNDAVTTTREKIQRSGWLSNEDGPTQQDKETFTVCEVCLELIGMQGNHAWKQEECDICGEKEFCCTFNPEDTMEPGDVYDNDVSNDQWPNDLSNIPFDTEELNRSTLYCNKCGAPTDPKIHTSGDVCDKPDCIGKYIFTQSEGTLVCNVCGTNWNPTWYLWCGKCFHGTKSIQFIPEDQRSKNGKTEKVCNQCFEPWAEPEGSTTCSRCNLGGSVSYKMIASPIPDVAPIHSQKPFEIPERRAWVPDYEGPRTPDGKIKLILKSTKKQDDENTDPNLYGIMS